MTGNSDRFLPVLHTWLDSFYHNGSTKNSSIQDCTNSSIRAFVHFLQIVLRHSGFIRGNGGTFNSNSIFLGGFRCIYSYLVISLISVFQSKIIVFCLQVNKRKKKLILDQLPQNSGHLVPVHLNKRGLHLNFTHYYLLVYVCGNCELCPQQPYFNVIPSLWQVSATIASSSASQSTVTRPSSYCWSTQDLIIFTSSLFLSTFWSPFSR